MPPGRGTSIHSSRTPWGHDAKISVINTTSWKKAIRIMSSMLCPSAPTRRLWTTSSPHTRGRLAATSSVPSFPPPVVPNVPNRAVLAVPRPEADGVPPEDPDGPEPEPPFPPPPGGPPPPEPAEPDALASGPARRTLKFDDPLQPFPNHAVLLRSNSSNRMPGGRSRRPGM